MKKIKLSSSVVVAGGGLAGVCAAIEASRMGVKTILVQNRPVLGGNSSSEIRVWTRGATGAGNLFSEETGILGMLKLKNLYVNGQFNVVFWDEILLDAVLKEKNITLLLNTNIDHVDMCNDRVQMISGVQQGSETIYELTADYFIDATGDGFIGAHAGVPYEIGDGKYEKDGTTRHLLSSSLLYYAVDTGRPVTYIAPDFAYDLSHIEQIINRGGRIVNERMTGSDCWWCEYGGLLNTITDSQEIGLELKKLIYGLWNYIKNSGKYPNALTYTLDWVGAIPGKRESRRFITEYMLTKDDILSQHDFSDSAFCGGWYIDTHPSEGINSQEQNCIQIPVGVYAIPFRTLYTKQVKNILFAGRIIGTKQEAFFSTRVMNTCGLSGQAAAVLAAESIRHQQDPDNIVVNHENELTEILLREDMFLPMKKRSANNLFASTKVKASSFFKQKIVHSDEYISLGEDSFLVLPVDLGRNIKVWLDNRSKNIKKLKLSFSITAIPHRAVDKKILEERQISIKPGKQILSLEIPEAAKGHFLLIRFYNATGIFVEKNRIDQPGILLGEKGLNKYEDPCVLIDNEIQYLPTNAINGYLRPYQQMNIWSADGPGEAWISLEWASSVSIREIRLYLDPELSQEIPSSTADRYGKSHNFEKRTGMPIHLAKDIEIEIKKGSELNAEWERIAEINNNCQRMLVVSFNRSQSVVGLRILFKSTWGDVAAHLYEIELYDDIL